MRPLIRGSLSPRQNGGGWIVAHKKLGRLQRVDPRGIWEREARDFTPWLAENLNLLGEVLSLDLELVQTEAPVGNYACDIEARERAKGRCVVIENQLDRTDHDHLGKLLTYAAGLEAGVVVWISPEIRDEHREAVDFLNHHTRDTIDFFAVTLDVVQIGDSAPAVVFRLAASPNAWAKTAALTSARRGAPSEKMEAYRRFWQPLIDTLREKHRFTNSRIAQAQSWHSFGSGVGGIGFNIAFADNERMRAEVYIDRGDNAQNTAIYDALHACRADIEAQMGEPLDWERLDDRQACRISVVRYNSPIERAELAGDEMRAWLIDALLKLKEVFGPRLPAIVASVGAAVQPSA